MNYWSRIGVDYTPKTTNQIIGGVCKHFQLSEIQLRSKCRLRPFVEARSIISYLLVTNGMTTTEAGRLINRDHSNVIHLNKKVGGFIQIDNNYKELVNSFI